MKKTFWLLAFFGILSACYYQKKLIEPVFQNSFSCKINGVDWKPEGGSNATGGIKSLSIDVGKYPYFNAISIDALKQIRDSRTGDNLTFEGFNFAVSLLPPNSTHLIYGNNFFYNFKNGCSSYYPDSLPSNRVTILALDTLSKIVKGTFEFEAKSPTCKQTVVITDGKFEVKY